MESFTDIRSENEDRKLTNCSQMLEGLFELVEGFAVCSVAYNSHTEIVKNATEICTIEINLPTHQVNSPKFQSMQAFTARDVVKGLEEMRRAEKSFDVFYIDHHHSFMSLVEQVNLCLKVAHSESIFIFGSAVPPEIGMAGPRPTQNWWLGEVWMLKHLLVAAGSRFFCHTIDLKPTGLMIARNFSPIKFSEIEGQYKKLASAGTTAELRHLEQHINAEQFYEEFRQSCLDIRQKKYPVIKYENLDDGAVVRVQLDERQPWVKRPPTFALDLSMQNYDLSHLFRQDRVLPGKFIDKHSDVLLIGPDIIIDDKYQAYARYVESSGPQIRRLAAEYGSGGNDFTQLHFRDQAVHISQEKLSEIVDLKDRYFLITPDEKDNWGMWVLLSIPSIAYFNEHRDRFDGALAYCQHEWQKNLLLSLGVAERDVIQQDIQQTYRMNEVSMIRRSFRDLSLQSSDLMVFQSIGDRFEHVRQRPAERIFISRITRTRKLSAYRGLVNEETLIEALQDIGFLVVEPDLLKFEEQVAIFRNAKVVVGLGGAGMFNTVFCRPETLVVSIESGLGFMDSHTNIFACAGLNYGVILGEVDESDPRPTQKRWSLDVNAAMKAIKSFVA